MANHGRKFVSAAGPHWWSARRTAGGRSSASRSSRSLHRRSRSRSGGPGVPRNREPSSCRRRTTGCKGSMSIASTSTPDRKRWSASFVNATSSTLRSRTGGNNGSKMCRWRYRCREREARVSDRGASSMISRARRTKGWTSQRRPARRFYRRCRVWSRRRATSTSTATRSSSITARA